MGVATAKRVSLRRQAPKPHIEVARVTEAINTPPSQTSRVARACAYRVMCRLRHAFNRNEVILQFLKRRVAVRFLRSRHEHIRITRKQSVGRDVCGNANSRPCAAFLGFGRGIARLRNGARRGRFLCLWCCRPCEIQEPLRPARVGANATRGDQFKVVRDLFSLGLKRIRANKIKGEKFLKKVFGADQIVSTFFCFFLNPPLRPERECDILRGVKA